jgi:Fe-S cluster assembly ATP-binding protein
MSTLELRNISVSAENKPVVSGVSLTLESGKVAVLMGPNGSGKSTLVNAVMGHPNYTVTAGTLTLDGEDILTLPPDQKAKKSLFLSLQHIPKVGGINLATFLHKVHVSLTGKDTDVLEYYLTLREMAKKLGIQEDLLDRPLTQGLSGGEKKLSEALQLAVLKPRFAILDEPDSGVDVDALKKVFSVIDMLKNEGTGFLIISHHPSLLSHLEPDVVFVMAGGNLMKSGGKELAESVLRDGFCKTIDCPLEERCEAKGVEK